MLEDLGRHRAVDQIEGLPIDDSLSVAGELARLHHHWAHPSRLAPLTCAATPPSGSILPLSTPA